MFEHSLVVNTDRCKSIPMYDSASHLGLRSKGLGPTKEFICVLRQHDVVEMISEHNTSQVCPDCTLRGLRPFKGDDKRIWSLKRCQSCSKV